MTDIAQIVANIDPEHGVFIGGAWQEANGGTFAVENPADQSVIAYISNGGVTEARNAVGAAAARLASWSSTAPRTRSDLLMKVRELMLRDADELAALIAAENGKSLGDARGEVVYAAEFFRWYAEEGVRPHGDFGTSPAGGVRTVVTSRPVGVAALATPWNFPAAMATRKMAPALAAGCTVVLKPASETPLTALAIGKLVQEAGVPDGVVNIVCGDRASEIVGAWMEDPQVKKISFTGSTAVGKVLLGQAAKRVLNASMELGGCAPFLVTKDADIPAAVEDAMIAKFRNGGQACTAANTFYVHADAADEFTQALMDKMTELKVGPASEGSDIGPLINKRALDGVSRLVEQAVAVGARVAYSSTVESINGHFYPPTLLVDVPADADVVREEIFGPVAPIVTWTNLETVLDSINASELGLAGYVFAGDLGTGMRIAERLEIGMIGINRGIVSDPAAPFGGTKQSGIGREGARAGLEEYLETQNFSIAW